MVEAVVEVNRGAVQGAIMGADAESDEFILVDWSGA